MTSCFSTDVMATTLRGAPFGPYGFFRYERCGCGHDLRPCGWGGGGGGGGEILLFSCSPSANGVGGDNLWVSWNWFATSLLSEEECPYCSVNVTIKRISYRGVVPQTMGLTMGLPPL